MLEVPANYFGKGENYNLPDDPEIIREFERRFQEWEAAHPEDPSGELALALAKKHNEPAKKINPPTSTGNRPAKEESAEEGIDWAELELTLPPDHITLLKNYAKFKRRRPRDIVMGWISQFCKL